MFTTIYKPAIFHQFVHYRLADLTWLKCHEHQLDSCRPLCLVQVRATGFPKVDHAKTKAGRMARLKMVELEIPTTRKNGYDYAVLSYLVKTQEKLADCHRLCLSLIVQPCKFKTTNSIQLRIDDPTLYRTQFCHVHRPKGMFAFDPEP